MDGMTVSEQVTEKKKGFPDWINLRKPANEEKDHWVSLIFLVDSVERMNRNLQFNFYIGALLVVN